MSQATSSRVIDPVAFMRVRESLAQLARDDFSAFCECTLRDERTNKLVVQSQVQQEWTRELRNHKKAVFWSHIESGKSSTISVARTLWKLGKDPTTRAVILSNTHRQAEKLSMLVKRYIETSPDLAMVFPNMKPGYPWASSMLNLRGHNLAKDPNLQITGIHGNILGSRIDYLVLDDVLDYENCRTEKNRQDLIDWYLATVAGRLTEDSEVVCIGTAFHPDDFLHWLAMRPGFIARRYPIVDQYGKSMWPDRWSQARIEEKRLELGELEFTRQMMCVPRDDSSARFKQEWIRIALRNGYKTETADKLDHIPPGWKCYTGVDLGVQPEEKNDETAMITILVDPDGHRYLLEVIAGRWAGPEIVGRILDVHNRFGSIVMVESNAAQAYIVQFVKQQSSVPVKSFQTDARSKFSPEHGVESLAVEMAAGKWSIPSPDGMIGANEQINRMLKDMLYYDPNAHVGDRLMALWLAREAARRGAMRPTKRNLAINVR